MVQVGDVLIDKYRLVRLLGEGGMGSVFEARHERIGKRLAVKVLHPQYAGREDVVARFTREAEAAAAIGHRSIIDIHDIGATSEGSLFLVMEYLQGQDLKQLIRRGPLDIPFSCYVVCEVLSALEAAHGQGVVHRDVKPDNIFLVDTDQTLPDIKLLDFGISKFVDHKRVDQTLTQTGAVIGTPYYMAPEQARGQKDLDHRVDIYAMGIILYFRLTGRIPFQAESLLSLVYEVLHSTPPLPRQLRPEVPQELELVVLKGMAREREDRYRTAADMLRALVPFVDPVATSRLSLARLGLNDRPWAPAPPKSAPAPAGTDDARPAVRPASTPLADTPTTPMAFQQVAPLRHSGGRKGRRWTTLAGGGIALGVLVAGGSAALLLTPGHQLESPPVSALSEPTAASALPPPPPPSSEPPSKAESHPDSVQVTFQGLPDQAQLFFDDQRVSGPVARRPRSSRPQQIRIEKDGFQTWHQTVRLERDTTIFVELQPLPPSRPQRPSAGEKAPSPAPSRSSQRTLPEPEDKQPRATPVDSRPERGVVDRFGSEFE